MKCLLFVLVFASSFLQAAFDITITVKNILQKNERTHIVFFEKNEREKTISLDDNGLQLCLRPNVINKDQISIEFKLLRVGSKEYFCMPQNFVYCEWDEEKKMPFEGSFEGKPYELCFVASKI